MDSVEALIKKHADFEGTSVAHEERTKALSEQANRLIHAGHYATTKYTCILHGRIYALEIEVIFSQLFYKEIE